MDISTGRDSGGNLRAITHANLKQGSLLCPRCGTRLTRAVVGPAIDATRTLAALNEVLSRLHELCPTGHQT